MSLDRRRAGKGDLNEGSDDEHFLYHQNEVFPPAQGLEMPTDALLHPSTRGAFSLSPGSRRPTATNSNVAGRSIDTGRSYVSVEAHDGHERLQIAVAQLSLKVMRFRGAAVYWMRWYRAAIVLLALVVILLAMVCVYATCFLEPAMFVGSIGVAGFDSDSVNLTVSVLGRNLNVRPVTVSGLSVSVQFFAPSPDFAAMLVYSAPYPVIAKMDSEIPAFGSVNIPVAVTVEIASMPRRMDLVGTPVSMLCSDARARFSAIRVVGAVQVANWGTTIAVPIDHTSQLFLPEFVPGYLTCAENTSPAGSTPIPPL